MLTLFLLFILSANADEFEQQVCALKGEIILTAPTNMICMKDLKIADGTRIVTQGYPLSLTAVGSINFGEPQAKGEPPPRTPGLRIYSFKKPAPQSHAAGPIFIYANTSFGTLEIYNRGASEKDLSGQIAIEYMTRGKSYSQTVDVANGTDVELIVNGFRLEPTKITAAKPGSESPTPANSTATEAGTKTPEKVHVARKVLKKPVRRIARPAPKQEGFPQTPFWNWSW